MLVVLGSINVDMVFKLDHLPAPGETVLTGGFDVLAGGKGANQAAAAAKAGGSVRMAGCVGDDGHGRMMQEILSSAGVEISTIAIVEKPSGLAIIAVDKAGENSIIVGSGANLAVSADQIGSLGTGDTLLCQNEIEPAETARALIEAKARGARTILNMAPAALLADDVLAAVDVLIVNELEARVVAQDEVAPLTEVVQSLVKKHDLVCITTLGAEGVLFADNGRLNRLPALRINPVYTTGAGDTFSGVLAAMLEEGQALEGALRHAIVAASLCCERLGAQTGQPSREEIEARIST